LRFRMLGDGFGSDGLNAVRFIGVVRRNSLIVPRVCEIQLPYWPRMREPAPEIC
jgi:hypothetical protein